MVDAKGGNYHKKKSGREQNVQDGRCRAVVGNVPQHPRITEGLLKSEGGGALMITDRQRHANTPARNATESEEGQLIEIRRTLALTPAPRVSKNRNHHTDCDKNISQPRKMWRECFMSQRASGTGAINADCAPWAGS